MGLFTVFGVKKRPDLASLSSVFQRGLLILNGLVASLFEILGSFFREKPPGDGRRRLGRLHKLPTTFNTRCSPRGICVSRGTVHYHCINNVASTKPKVNKNLSNVRPPCGAGILPLSSAPKRRLEACTTSETGHYQNLCSGGVTGQGCHCLGSCRSALIDISFSADRVFDARFHPQPRRLGAQ